MSSRSVRADVCLHLSPNWFQSPDSLSPRAASRESPCTQSAAEFTCQMSVFGNNTKVYVGRWNKHRTLFTKCSHVPALVIQLKIEDLRVKTHWQIMSVDYMYILDNVHRFVTSIKRECSTVMDPFGNHCHSSCLYEQFWVLTANQVSQQIPLLKAFSNALYFCNRKMR